MQGILSDLLKEKSFSVTEQVSNRSMVSNLKIAKVAVRLSSEIQKHMREDGVTVVDSRTIKPMELVVSAYIPSVDVMDEVNRMVQDRDGRYRISTRGLVFENFVCVSDHIRQTPEMLSSTPVDIVFQQLLLQNFMPVIFLNSQDSSLIDRGRSVINDAKSTVTDLFEKGVKTVQDQVKNLKLPSFPTFGG